MKKFLVLFLFQLLTCLIVASAQGYTVKSKLTNETVVKDSSGKVYAADQWKEMIMSGKYSLKAVNPQDEKTEYLILPLSEEEQKLILERMPPPRETTIFTTGKTISSFSAKDIEGAEYRLKSLKGKVVVLNFWYIACAPCQMEMPELNKLVAEYKDSTDMVFLSICLDEESMIRKFLERKTFDYKIIGSGREIAGNLGIKGFPTHVVLDKEGKVCFHTTGYGMNTVPWLRKSISKALQ